MFEVANLERFSWAADMDYHVSVFSPPGAQPRASIVRELGPHFPDSPEARNGL